LGNFCWNCMKQMKPGAKFCTNCGQDLTDTAKDLHHLIPGTKLRDRYIVGNVLGEGGFGITYVGWDTLFGIKVAIKEFYMAGYVSRINTYSPTVQVSMGNYTELFEKTRSRFLEEAKVLVRFRYEDGIVGIQDFFQENNTAYIVMDFLDGETLKSFLHRNGTISWAQTFSLMRPVLESLSRIHEHHIIHRDISPDNIMLTRDGKVKLLDFGAARDFSGVDGKSLSVILKPGFAPEEQYRTRGQQGPWTDVYALCATMYRCLTGITPDESMERVVDDRTKSPAELCDCPKAVSDVLMKGLAVLQRDRIQTVDELLAAFANAAELPARHAAPIPVPESADPDATVFAGIPQIPAIAPEATVFSGEVIRSNPVSVSLPRNPSIPVSQQPVPRSTIRPTPIPVSSAMPTTGYKPASNQARVDGTKPTGRKKLLVPVLVALLVVVLTLGTVMALAAFGVVTIPGINDSKRDVTMEKDTSSDRAEKAVESKESEDESKPTEGPVSQRPGEAVPAGDAPTADTPVADTPVHDAPVSDVPAADKPTDIPTEESTTPPQEEVIVATPKEPTVVTYFCTNGLYLDVLTAEIDKWNAGEGAEKGVYIELTVNINDGSAALELQMQAGNHWDIMDGASNTEWVLQGWVQDLSVVDDPELQELIRSYEPYMVPNLSWKEGILTALPMEAVPIKMAINLDLFAAAGYDANDLRTWDDVVEIAQGITEANPGIAWGYGGTTWSAMIRRLTFKATASSNAVGWWDPRTGTYSFDQYEEPMTALKTMYENGWMLGLDDLAIDPIRAEFAAGKVGMFPAPAYDWSVYDHQFPAACNFAFVDMPVYGDDGGHYKGVCLDRVGCGIDAVCWEYADDVKKQAIVDAFLFLNSDELYATIYANGGMIPYKPEIREGTELAFTENAEQWKQMSDLDGYTNMWLYPDGIIPLEGDTYATVMRAYIQGNISWDVAVADLERRYNAAWAAAVSDPDINTDIYLYNYTH